MHISNFTEKMQQIAPRELKMDYDNVGLLIGPEKQEIRRVLVALDCTSVTAKEAIEWGADLMLTHHPVFFRGTKRIAPDDPATAGAYMLIRHRPFCGAYQFGCRRGWRERRAGGSAGRAECRAHGAGRAWQDRFDCRASKLRHVCKNG